MGDAVDAGDGSRYVAVRAAWFEHQEQLVEDEVFMFWDWHMEFELGLRCCVHSCDSKPNMRRCTSVPV